jgi:hypothetical protein
MTITATPTSPVLVYYCKAGIQTGKTIRVLQAGAVHETAAVEISDAWATMQHDNSSGKAKRSGARCVLILNRGTVTFTE